MSCSFSGKDCKGCWAIVENANNKEKKTGLKLQDWLRNMDLFHSDDTREVNRINDVCVDLGFIKPSYNHSLYNFGWGDKNSNEIYVGYLRHLTTKDIIKSLYLEKDNYCKLKMLDNK